MEKEIIEKLLKIENNIKNIYKKLIEIDLSESSNKKDIYKAISLYRNIEDSYLSKLGELCKNKKNIEELYDYFYDTFELSDDVSLILNYINDFDYSLVIRRIIEKLDRENIIYLEDENENNEDLEENYDILKRMQDDEVDSQKTMKFLMEDEDAVRFVNKIDNLLLNKHCDNFLSKEELLKIKYDTIFINSWLEENLIKEYYLIPLDFVDSKRIMALKFNFNDEDIEKYYESIRESEMLILFDELSQKRNENDTYKNKLYYLYFDLLAESITDEKLADIIGKIDDKTSNSYNEIIERARKVVYNILYEKYHERIRDYEIIEEELSEEEIEKEEEKIKEKKISFNN